jgi:glycosyltransferase involved in cell wall biosynthesis
VIRAVGGAVALHDWVLFDLAVAAFPELERSSLRGLAAVLREGGLAQARTWARNRMQRRAQRLTPFAPLPEAALPPGELLAGWHDPEPDGRWCADAVQWRARGARLRLVGRAPAARTLRLSRAGRELVVRELPAGPFELELEAPEGGEALWTARLEGVEVTLGQRAAGDGRRLGLFVTQLAHETPLDLAQASALPLRSVFLARDRFALPLNRSVVRFADAFVVHSEHVARLVRDDRNAPTPVGLVRHGADPAWSSEPRALERERLGLPRAWCEGFLVTSFGAIQAHKRIDVLLEAVARARRSRPGLHLALVGGEEPSEYDVRGAIARRALAPHVRITGRLPERELRRWLHAGDLGVQLRGPSTGGTSGAIFQTLAAGRGLIASALDEQNELPAECVYKLHPAEDEAGRLAQKLVELTDAPAVRAAMETSARDFVERECRWAVVGARYLELCERFPRPRAARRSLFSIQREERGSAGAAAPPT